MMLKLLRWLRRMPRDERRETMHAAKELREKSREVDRKIENGRACADKLKQSFERQVQESDGVSDMLRNLMDEMDHEGRAR